MNTIINGFVKGIKSIGEETVEKTVEHTGKIASGIITGADLVGGKPPMTEDDRQKALQEDEAAVARAMASQGRDVEKEIDRVRDEKTQKENDEEKFLENLKKQREAEERERMNMQVDEPGNSKREAVKYQFSPGKRKKQAPDPASMSATAEMTGGKID